MMSLLQRIVLKSLMLISILTSIIIVLGVGYVVYKAITYPIPINTYYECHVTTMSQKSQ